MWAAAGISAVAVIAHPDDEAWAMGGTLAALTSSGATVTIVCVTDGALDGEVTQRRGELARSCAILGCEEPAFLGFSDACSASWDRQALRSAIGAVLTRLRPDIVFGLGRDGGYGHIDHTALWSVLRLAYADFSKGADADGRDGQSRRCLLETKFAPGLLSPVRRALKKRRPNLLDPSVVQVGESPVNSDVVVDIAPIAARKHAAVAAHRSQRPTDDPSSFLGGVVEALSTHERFSVAAGERPVLLHVTRDLLPRANGGISVLARALLHANGPLRPAVVSFDGWRPKRRDPAPTPQRLKREAGVEVLRLTHPAQLDVADRWVAELRPAAAVVHHALLWGAVESLSAVPRTYLQHVDQAEMDRIRGLSAPTASAVCEARAIAEAERIVRPRDVWPTVDRDVLLPESEGALPNDPKRSECEVLFAGRLSDIKGADVWLEALNEVAGALPHATFAIAGGNPDSPKLERRWRARWSADWSTEVQARVTWLGWLARPQLHSRLRSAALVVVPSRAETWGLVAWEAAAVGANMICADLPSLREAVASGRAVAASTGGAGQASFIASETPADWAKTVVERLHCERVATSARPPERDDDHVGDW